MRQTKLLLLFVVVFAILLVGCANPGSDPSQPPDPAVSEPEEALISIDLATDELLSKYDSYVEFIEFEDEGYQKIILTTNIAVKDFSFREVGIDEEGTDYTYFEEGVLYSLEELSPEKPFVVTWMEWGSIPHRGISFRDGTDTTRYFYIAMSGRDGSLYLAELEPDSNL